MLLSHMRQSLRKGTVVPDVDVDVLHLTADSRLVQPGSLFIALRGHTVDGHDFVAAAAQAGAVAAMVEQPQPVAIPQWVVPDARLASGVVASCFYRHPADRLRMVGVTGTNGKTTTSLLIDHILRGRGCVTGVIGTVGAWIAGQWQDVVNTTPDAVTLQSVLATMAAAGCHYGVMEVSSHALAERRTAGTRYQVAVFTNLTQDHLDFHGTMDAYRAAKGKLFARLGNAYADEAAAMPYAVLNADDAASAAMADQTVYESLWYGIDNAADVRAVNVRIEATGAHFRALTFCGDCDVRLQLTGRFNVYNALAALTVGLAEGIPLAAAVRSLEAVPGVPGRLERVDAGQPFTILVDYSHTPDGLENALTTVREFAHGRVLTVVGCGGDRDRGKRPLMARTATNYSDYTLLTSDNPRTEDPQQILDDMERGLADRPQAAYGRMQDRRAAIAAALDMAGADDVVLIAGKGHETYQIIGRTKHHFDDREVAREVIRAQQRSCSQGGE